MKPILFFLLSALLVLLTSTGTVWSLTTERSSNGQEQIDWIIDQQNLSTGLVDSYESGDDDEAWIYDQALAIIALTKAGELDRARMILDKMEFLQLDNDGCWYEGYQAEDATAINQQCITGPIAWVVIGINFYERQTGDSSYAAMAGDALGCLDTMRNENEADEWYGSLKFSTAAPDTLISTEHNVDAYSAYYWRGILDSDNSYIAKANLVLDYLRTEMWAPSEDSNDIHEVVPFVVEV